MSVFTPVSLDEARAFIAPYQIGEIIDFQDIAAGAENSNFFVTTSLGRYVLTIFEKHPREDLDFYLGLMQHVHQAGIPSAKPMQTADGTMLHTLKGKPAAVVARLSGNDIAHPSVADCAAIGQALANLHQATRDFKPKMPNWRGFSWWQQYAADLKGHLPAADNKLIFDELLYQAGFNALPLPRGIIHADLFRDNVLWGETGEHAGHTPQMIDFYFACEEFLLFDLAVAVNDWCLDLPKYPVATLDATRARALIAGYASVRPLTPNERAAWPQVLRAAVLRFWLGRLGYHYFPRDSALTHPRDHGFLERLLRHHIAETQSLAALLPAPAL